MVSLDELRPHSGEFLQLDIMLAGSDIVKYSGRNPRRSDMKDYTVNEHEVTRVHLSEQGDSLVDGNVVELNPYSNWSLILLAVLDNLSDQVEYTRAAN